MLKKYGKGTMKNRVIEAVDELSYKLYSASKQSDSEYKKALKKYEEVKDAVDELTDQAELFQIAMGNGYDTYPMTPIRSIALNKLTEQKAIALIAKDAKTNSCLRTAAVRKLTDQDKLVSIANIDDLNGIMEGVHEAAIEKLSDQGVLIDIAKTGRTSSARLLAAEKLTNKSLAQDVYYDIAMNNQDIDDFHEIYAAEKLTDQKLLSDIALRTDIWNVFETAVLKLTDLETLADIVKHDERTDMRYYEGFGSIQCNTKELAERRMKSLQAQEAATSNTIHLPLKLTNGHIFVELNGDLWLIDTGAPTSFGVAQSITLCDEQFTLDPGYQSYTADDITLYTEVTSTGLIGVDILNRFDIIFDFTGGKLIFSTTELTCDGKSVYMDDFMGIPIITVQVGDNDHRMIFDIGAQISYFIDDSLTEFPSAEIFKDFHFTIGHYETETYNVPMSLGDIVFTLRCGGTLPGTINATLTAASVQGIIGNDVLKDRKVGYFPRRNMMVLGQ